MRRDLEDFLNMVLKIVSFAALGLFAVPVFAETTLTLTLPNEPQVTARFFERAIDGLRLYSLENRFEDADGLEWMRRLNKTLDSAYAAYVSALKSGQAPFCVDAPEARPTLELVFYNFKPSTSDADSRFGYFHRENRAVIVQDRLWDSAGVTTLAVHEAVHSWCEHKEYESIGQRWLEEGLADWIAFKATGQKPQQAVTNYFAEPCRPTNYGSSFLWWAALLETGRAITNEVFLLRLASLHLGLRLDFIFGKISGRTCGEAKNDARTPYGFLSKTADGGKKTDGVLPVWERANRPVSLKAPANGSAPTGFFIWRGLMPR